MTVLELIEELENYPKSAPVVCNLKEVTDISFVDSLLYLDKSEAGYSNTPAVVLE